MQKPLQISPRWIKVIMRTMAGGFMTLIAAVGTLILISWHKGHTVKMENLELHGKVTGITQPDYHEMQWFVAKVTGSNGIVPEHQMIGVLAPGDSLFRKKDEDFYPMKKMAAVKRITTALCSPDHPAGRCPGNGRIIAGDHWH